MVSKRHAGARVGRELAKERRCSLMGPATITLELTEKEPVSGTARLRLVDTEVSLQLPEARVEFTH